jgi:hypothetical protein
MPCCFALIGMRQRQYRGFREWSAADLKTDRQPFRGIVSWPCLTFGLSSAAIDVACLEGIAEIR